MWTNGNAVGTEKMIRPQLQKRLDLAEYWADVAWRVNFPFYSKGVRFQMPPSPDTFAKQEAWKWAFDALWGHLPSEERTANYR